MVNGRKCIQVFKVTFTRIFSKLWQESFIAKANDCTESLHVYKTHRLPKLFRIKVSSRNSASEILFRTNLLRNFSFSPNERLYRKH